MVKKLDDTLDARCGWHEITPGDALLLLKAQGKNRPVSETKVNRLAKAISAGRFYPNGESIVVTAGGVLLDGQHRLRACVAAEKAIKCYVVYLSKSPEEFFDSIDQGSARTAGDRIALDGAKRDKEAAALTRMCMTWDRYGYTHPIGANQTREKGRDAYIGVGEIRDHYLKHRKEIDETCEAVAMFAHFIRGWAIGSLVSFVYMMAARHDHKKADEWLHGLATGENLSGDNPVLKLRRRLQAEAVSEQRLKHTDATSLMIQSWNAYATGKPIKALAVQTEMPRFVGAAQVKK